MACPDRRMPPSGLLSWAQLVLGPHGGERGQVAAVERVVEGLQCRDGALAAGSGGVTEPEPGGGSELVVD